MNKELARFKTEFFKIRHEITEKTGEVFYADEIGMPWGKRITITASSEEGLDFGIQQCMITRINRGEWK